MPDSIGVQFHCDIFHLEELYFLIVVEAITRYGMVVRLASKAKEVILEALKLVCKQYELLNYFGPKEFCWDGETGVTSLVQEASLHGIKLTQTGAGDHEKIAENYTRNMENALRAIQKDMEFKLHKSMTCFLVEHAVRTMNHQPSTINQTRWSLIHKKPDDGSSLYEFGSFVMVKQPEYKRTNKLEDRNVLAIRIALNLCLSLESFKILNRTTMYKITPTQEQIDLANSLTNIPLNIETQEEVNLENESDPEFQETSFTPIQTNTNQALEPSTQNIHQPETTTINGKVYTTTRSGRPTLHHDWSNMFLSDDMLTGVEDVVITNLVSTLDGSTEQDEKTKESIMQEIRNLIRYRVLDFQVNTNELNTREVIPLMMTTQTKVDGRIKTRICVRGDKQDSSLEYSSPVTNPETTLILLNALISNNQFHVAILDVGSAYLEATLTETIHVKLSKEMANLFIKEDTSLRSKCNPDGTLYAKLRKALYGLRQSGKCWYDTLSNILTGYGFRCTNPDPCLFIKSEGQEWVAISVHVDDMLVVGTKEAKLNALHLLEKSVEVLKINDDPTQFKLLGMTFTREGNRLHYSLPHLEDKICASLDSIPKSTKTYKTNHPYLNTNGIHDDTLLNEEERKIYVSIVAKLNYLALHTRQELRCAVSFAASKQSKPTIHDQESLMRIVKYLRDNPHLGPNIVPSDMQLRGSADASFLSHPDQSKGHSGAVFWFGEQNAPIYTLSTKQPIICLSSMECELVALASASRELVKLVAICEILGFKQNPVPIEQDNQSLMIVLNTTNYVGSTKHWNLRFHYVINQIKERLFYPEYVQTNSILADPLSKPYVSNISDWRKRLLNSM